MDAKEFSGNLIALLEECIAEKENVILENNKSVGHASINGIDEIEDVLAMHDYVMAIWEAKATIQTYEEIRGQVERLLIEDEDV